MPEVFKLVTVLLDFLCFLKGDIQVADIVDM